jgi:hypothetical protein
VALASLVAATSACSAGDDDEIKGLTLDQLRVEIVAAMFPADGVMHTSERIEPAEGVQVVTPEQDIWRSASTDEARIEVGASKAVIFSDGARHTLDAAGEPLALEYARLEDNYALLGSTSVLFGPAATGAKLYRADIDGAEAIRVEVSLPGGDGTGAARVFIDETSRLPVRIEYPNFTAQIEHQVVDRGGLAADFFSPDALLEDEGGAR